VQKPRRAYLVTERNFAEQEFFDVSAEKHHLYLSPFRSRKCGIMRHQTQTERRNVIARCSAGNRSRPCNLINCRRFCSSYVSYDDSGNWNLAFPTQKAENQRSQWPYVHRVLVCAEVHRESQTQHCWRSCCVRRESVDVLSQYVVDEQLESHHTAWPTPTECVGFFCYLK